MVLYSKTLSVEVSHPNNSEEQWKSGNTNQNLLNNLSWQTEAEVLAEIKKNLKADIIIITSFGFHELGQIKSFTHFVILFFQTGITQHQSNSLLSNDQNQEQICVFAVPPNLFWARKSTLMGGNTHLWTPQHIFIFGGWKMC